MRRTSAGEPDPSLPGRLGYRAHRQVAPGVNRGRVAAVWRSLRLRIRTRALRLSGSDPPPRAAAAACPKLPVSCLVAICRLSLGSHTTSFDDIQKGSAGTRFSFAQFSLSSRHWLETRPQFGPSESFRVILRLYRRDNADRKSQAVRVRWPSVEIAGERQGESQGPAQNGPARPPLERGPFCRSP